MWFCNLHFTHMIVNEILLIHRYAIKINLFKTDFLIGANKISPQKRGRWKKRKFLFLRFAILEVERDNVRFLSWRNCFD